MSAPAGSRPSPPNQTSPKHPLPDSETAYAGADQQQPIEETSIGQLIGDISRDMSTLMRQELELAKAEMSVKAKEGGKGAGMLGGSGVAALLMLGALTATVIVAADSSVTLFPS